MPARAIVILRQVNRNPAAFDYLLRADVPAGRQILFAQPGYVSPFVPLAPDLDPDVAGLQAGAIVEELHAGVVCSATPAEFRASLMQQQAAFQQRVTNDPTYSRYGSYFDGTTWVAQGV